MAISNEPTGGGSPPAAANPERPSQPLTTGEELAQASTSPHARNGRELGRRPALAEQPAAILASLAVTSPDGPGAARLDGALRLSAVASSVTLIDLVCDRPDVVLVPRSVQVDPNEQGCSFPIQTRPGAAPVSASITATGGGVSLATSFVVQPRPWPYRAAATAVSWGQGLIAALVITAPVAPIAGGMISAAAFLTPLAQARSVLEAGIFNLLAAWAVMGFVTWLLGLTSPDRASMGTYGEFLAQLPEIAAWLDWSRRQSGPSTVLGSQQAWEVARHELGEQVQAIARERERRGARWVLGTGYITLWQRLHRAQEAVIDLEPPDAVIKHAQLDAVRINGSTMAHSDHYVALLRNAVEVLSLGRHGDASLDRLLRAIGEMLAALGTPEQPGHESATALGARAQLLAGVLRGLPTPFDNGQLAAALDAAQGKLEPGSQEVADLRTQLQAAASYLTVLAASGPSAADVGSPPADLQPPRSVPEAVALVRTIRRTLSEFRDNSRMGLVRARNELLATVGITSVTAYSLLWLGMGSASARPYMIEAAIAFFLVGAVVGLFTRLYVEASMDKGVDDYGLSLSRLIAAPLLAGLAGLLGVVLVSMTSATQDGRQLTALADAFNLSKTPLNLVTAAVFGLSPGLLISRLTQSGEQFKTDLKSSEAPSGVRKAS